MHCSYWTGKRASIDFDRNWATFMVNFTRTADSSQRFTPSHLAEGKWDPFFARRSTAVWGTDTCSLAEKWHQCHTSTHTHTHLARHFIQLFNHLLHLLICTFFLTCLVKHNFFSLTPVSERDKKYIVFVTMSSSAALINLTAPSWMNGRISCLVCSPFKMLLDSNAQIQGQLSCLHEGNMFVSLLYKGHFLCWIGSWH